MQQLKIEKGKYYRTRNGLKVEIYSTNNYGLYPIHGRIFESNLNTSCIWNKNGFVANKIIVSQFDIVADWETGIL